MILLFHQYVTQKIIPIPGEVPTSLDETVLAVLEDLNTGRQFLVETEQWRDGRLFQTRVAESDFSDFSSYLINIEFPEDTKLDFEWWQTTINDWEDYREGFCCV